MPHSFPSPLPMKEKTTDSSNSEHFFQQRRNFIPASCNIICKNVNECSSGVSSKASSRKQCLDISATDTLKLSKLCGQAYDGASTVPLADVTKRLLQASENSAIRLTSRTCLWLNKTEFLHKSAA